MTSLSVAWGEELDDVVVEEGQAGAEAEGVGGEVQLAAGDRGGELGGAVAAVAGGEQAAEVGER
jgi:hypothetical protein